MEHNETNDLSPERVKRLLQESILRNYPNPERRGCPGEQILREVARQRLPHEHKSWQHITHCSPCYQEFLEMHLQVRERRRTNMRIAFVTAVFAAAALVVLIWAGVFQRSAPNVPLRTHEVPRGREADTLTAVLNMEGTSSIRGGEESATTKANGLQRLPRAQIAPLLIYLPFGSSPGLYEVHLLRNDRTSKSPLATFSGTAEIKDGFTILQLSPDLSMFTPGIYVISVLRGGVALWSCQFRLS